MAIHNNAPGIRVEVHADGHKLEEYIDQAEAVSPQTVTVYIEAKSDQIFKISYVIGAPFPPEQEVALKVYVDGKHMHTSVHTVSRLYGAWNCRGSTEHIEADGDLSLFRLRNFMFAKLETCKWIINPQEVYY
jgi:hypothetical protein